ncbi:MAG TPA: quinone oxidoreductase [Casimicrobiaceae bacterium]
MRAIVVDRFGGPEVLEVRDIDIPEPGPGEVRVRLAFAGINYIDVYMRTGAYARSDTYGTPLPMGLGMEGAGTVDAIGPAVEGFASGQRVAWCIVRGAYAEYAVVPAWRLVPVPGAVPLDIACALMLQGSTAHYLTHAAHPVRAGDVCVVHAGAGGVGQLLIQLAKMRGGTVIATVGTRDKAAIARARGADHTVLYREVAFRDEVVRITSGRGADVVYDSVGRDTVHASIRSLRKRGLCVMYGASSGQVDCIAPLELAEAGSVYFSRPHLADYLQDAAEIRGRARDLFAALASGDLAVSIDRVFALAQAADAHRVLEGRESRGKLLLALG